MNNEIKYTLLTVEDLKNTTLKEELKHGSDASDFAKMLGAWTKDENETCTYWLKDETKRIKNGSVEINTFNSNRLVPISADNEAVSILPITNYSSIKDYLDSDNCFGEYPQTALDMHSTVVLESHYLKGELKRTGKIYTTDSSYFKDWKNDEERYFFEPHQHYEYMFNNKKYVRVSGFEHSQCKNIKSLSILNDIYWAKVEPIHWLIDVEHDLAIPDRALLSGIRYYYKSFDGIDLSSSYKKFHPNFEDNAIYKFLNKYFAKEIVPLNTLDKNIKYTDDMYNDMVSKKFK